MHYPWRWRKPPKAEAGTEAEAPAFFLLSGESRRRLSANDTRCHQLRRKQTAPDGRVRRAILDRVKYRGVSSSASHVVSVPTGYAFSVVPETSPRQPTPKPEMPVSKRRRRDRKPVVQSISPVAPDGQQNASVCDSHGRVCRTGLGFSPDASLQLASAGRVMVHLSLLVDASHAGEPQWPEPTTTTSVPASLTPR